MTLPQDSKFKVGASGWLCPGHRCQRSQQLRKGNIRSLLSETGLSLSPMKDFSQIRKSLDACNHKTHVHYKYPAQISSLWTLYCTHCSKSHRDTMTTSGNRAPAFKETMVWTEKLSNSHILGGVGGARLQGESQGVGQDGYHTPRATQP